MYMYVYPYGDYFESNIFGGSGAVMGGGYYKNLMQALGFSLCYSFLVVWATITSRISGGTAIDNCSDYD